MVKEKSAGAIIYAITDGSVQYLLLQASPGKPWGFPKGKIDAGETEDDAARREVREEAGLTHLSFEPDFRAVVHYVYRHGRVLVKKDVVYFLARTDTTEINISWEHVAYRWASLAESLELVNYENARELLLRVQQYLIAHYGELS